MSSEPGGWRRVARGTGFILAFILSVPVAWASGLNSDYLFAPTSVFWGCFGVVVSTGWPLFLTSFSRTTRAVAFVMLLFVAFCGVQGSDCGMGDSSAGERCIHHLWHHPEADVAKELRLKK